ncbi:MAG: ABC transporter permease [Pseudonocardiaceae bacterium]
MASRLGQLVLVLLALSALSFGLLGLTRGDTATAVVKARGGTVTPEAVADERHHLGLDQPAIAQYLTTLRRAAQGDLGTSVRTGRQVADEVGTRLGPTLILAGAGSLVTIAVGLGIGLIEASTRSALLDTTMRGASLVAISVPPFALAFALVAVLALQLGWLPTQGTQSWRALILPAVVLGLAPGAALGRVLSNRLREVMAEPYYVTTRAQGFSTAACLLRCALPNAAVTALVVGGNLLALVVTGTLVVEELFGWPGLGSYLIDALRFRDWYPLQAGVLALAALAVAVRGVSLVLAAALDPRTRVA